MSKRGTPAKQRRYDYRLMYRKAMERAEAHTVHINDLELRLVEALDRAEKAEAALEEREGDMHLRIRAEYDATVADAWKAENERLRGHIRGFIKWSEKYPSTRIYSEHSIRVIASEHDALVESARSALGTK